MQIIFIDGVMYMDTSTRKQNILNNDHNYVEFILCLNTSDQRHSACILVT